MALQVWLPLLGNLENQGLTSTTLTNTNAVVNANGKIGQCYQFSANAYLLGTSAPLNNNTEEWSYACWLKLTSTAAGCLLSNRIQTSTAGIAVFYYGSQWLIDDGVRWSFTPVTQLTTGRWYHICVTRKKGVGKCLYIDGVLDSSTTTTGTPTDANTSHYSIGASQTGQTSVSGNALNGYLNDVRVYDHCLSDKEVKELSKGLIAHFPLADPYVEYTTNIVTVQKYESGASTGWGGHSAVTSDYDSTNDPVPSNTISKITCTYSGSGGGGFGYRAQSVTVSPSTTYTYSAYVKTEDDFATANANILYRYEYPGTPSSPGTKITETGCYSASNRQSLGNGWYRCWGTFTTNSATNCVQLYFYGYPNKNCNYWVGCWQLEQKDHMTPYILGSRNGSSANTVYDASGYKNNGVSQVDYGLAVDTNSIRHKYCTYFNSGINNYFRAPITISTNLSTVTMSVWIRSKSGVAGYGSYHTPLSINGREYEFSIEKTNSGGGYFRNGFYCNGSRVVNTTPGPDIITDKKWHMITATYDGTAIRRYVDGVEVQTQAASGTLNGGSKTIYGGTLGTDTSLYTKELYQSDMRIYATALSAADIKELYEVSGHIDNTGKLYSYELVEV